jgi:hypothetical protein
MKVLVDAIGRHAGRSGDCGIDEAGYGFVSAFRTV